MIQPSTNGRSGLRPRHGALAVGSVVLAAIVVYAAFVLIAGIIGFLVKAAVVVGVAYLVVKLVFRRTKPS
jgi:hypothetical protein